MASTGEHDGDKTMHSSTDKDVKVLEDGLVLEQTITGDRKISASIAIDPAAEKRLVWKFDSRILPVLAVMYLFNA